MTHVESSPIAAHPVDTGAPDVSIIVVSYNTRDLTLACLRSVSEQTQGVDHEIIVIDNDSDDGSADAIGETRRDVLLVRAGRNLGFAAANNLAVEHARGRYILLLNPDTVVLDGAVQRLIAFARRRPTAGIWGGRTLFADRTLNPGSCWGRMTLWSLACAAIGVSSVFRGSAVFNPEGFGAWPRDSDRAVDIVSGCFLLITRELWDSLGGFDCEFFMYGEDYDLCIRSRSFGARPAITPDATIIHYGGASERVRSDKMIRLLAAKMLLLRRHVPPRARGLAVMLLAAWPLSRSFIWRAISVFRGSAPARESAAAWSEVWRRRSEWIRGFRRADSPLVDN